MESERTLVDARGQMRVGGELMFNGDRVSVQEDEKSGRWVMMRAIQQCECCVQLNLLKQYVLY